MWVRTGAVVCRLAFLLPVGDRAVQVEVRPLGVVQVVVHGAGVVAEGEVEAAVLGQVGGLVEAEVPLAAAVQGAWIRERGETGGERGADMW